jgi:hypothetical protein
MATMKGKRAQVKGARFFMHLIEQDTAEFSLTLSQCQK